MFYVFYLFLFSVFPPHLIVFWVFYFILFTVYWILLNCCADLFKKFFFAFNLVWISYLLFLAYLESLHPKIPK